MKQDILIISKFPWVLGSWAHTKSNNYLPPQKNSKKPGSEDIFFKTYYWMWHFKIRKGWNSCEKSPHLPSNTTDIRYALFISVTSTGPGLLSIRCLLNWVSGATQVHELGTILLAKVLPPASRLFWNTKWAEHSILWVTESSLLISFQNGNNLCLTVTLAVW